MLLTQRSIEMIHEATLRILENTGVRFDHKGALDVFRKAGLRIEGETVFIDSKTLENCLASCPRKIHIKAINKDNDIVLGSGQTYCGPVSGAVYVNDYKQGQRLAVAQDYLNFTKLSHTSSMMKLVGGIMVTPSDIPADKLVAFMMLCLFTHTDKALWGLTMDGKKSQECIDIGRIVFGAAKEPFIMGLANVMTPLVYDEKMVDAIACYAMEGQAICITCCGISGFTSPVTLAGTLAVNNAEVLAGVVLTQLLSPGAPVIYGNVSAPADMRTMGIALGSPETSLLAQAASQLALYYRLPSRTGGTFTNAVDCDFQAGYESTLLMLASHLSKTDVLLLSAGSLDSVMTASYEKFILDEEIYGMVQRYMAGIEVSEETLALELIQELGPGGNYVTSDHTFEHYRNELFIPKVSNRQLYEKWMLDKKTRVEAAHEIYAQRMNAYAIPEAVKDNRDVSDYWKKKYGVLPECLK